MGSVTVSHFSQSEVQISVSGSLMPSLLGLLAYFVGQTLSCVFKFCYLGQHFQQNMLLWSQGLASISSPTELCAERVPRWNWSVKSILLQVQDHDHDQPYNFAIVDSKWSGPSETEELYMLLVYVKVVFMGLIEYDFKLNSKSKWLNRSNQI